MPTTQGGAVNGPDFTDSVYTPHNIYFYTQSFLFTGNPGEKITISMGYELPHNLSIPAKFL